MKKIWFFLALVAIPAQAKVDAALLGQIEQSPPCEGLDLLSDKVLHTFKVPDSCPETKAFQARVVAVDDRLRSDCRSTTAQYSERIRGAATCQKITLDQAGMEYLSHHLHELRDALNELEQDALSGKEAKAQACQAAHKDFQEYARKEEGLMDQHYGILNYVVEDPCGNPGANEYLEFLRKGES